MAISYAIKVTPENIAYIVDTAKAHNLNLADYIFDTLEDANNYGINIYSIMSFSGNSAYPTFTEFEERDFRSHWTFIFNENPNEYVRITRT